MASLALNNQEDAMDVPFIHRKLPGGIRHKLCFDGDIPPLYVHRDNFCQYHVDTHYILPSLRQWIDERLGAMRTAALSVLDEESKEEYDLIALYTAHVTLTLADNSPVIEIRFDDIIERKPLQGAIDGDVILMLDEVVDDFLDTALQFQNA